MITRPRAPAGGANHRHGQNDKHGWTNRNAVRPLVLLLDAVERVTGQAPRKNGSGWRCDCPNGHQSARGTLAVTEAEDGRVLLHCFACSDVAGILRKLGLVAAELFPPRPRDLSPADQRASRNALRQVGWRAALRLLNREAQLVHVAAYNVRHGFTLAPADLERLDVACDRIAAAAEVLV